MAIVINVKKKEIRIKDINMIVEDEVFPENVEFIINEASSIHNVENLRWVIQYKRTNSDNGFDLLTPTYTDGSMYLSWHPTAGFTKEKGKVDIQIVGIELEGTTYVTRWSTYKTTIDLPESLVINNISPVITPDWLAQFIAQMQGFVDSASQSAITAAQKASEAEASALEIENMTVSSESLEPDEEATVEKTVGEVVNLHFGIPKGEKGDKGDKGDTGEQGEKGDTGEQGEKGDGVEQILMYYAVTQTQDEPSSITSPTIPPMSSINKYLWRKEVFIYTDLSEVEAVSLIAIYGDTGEDYPVTDVRQNGVSIVDEDGVADITIPSAPVQSISKNGTQVLPDSQGNVNLIIPTQASDVGALPSNTKYGATLEVSINTSTYVCSFKLKDQDGSLLGTEQTIDLPLEEMIVSGSYDSATKKIVLTLRNGNVIEVPVGDIISGLVTQASLNTTLQSYYTKTEADGKFVGQVSGKGLSTNDYTTAEKNKLQGIEAGAEANVQSDWEQTDSTDDSFIKNKPSIPTTLAELTGDSTHRTVTDTEKTTWSGKQDAISDLSTIRSNASAGKTASDTIATYGDIVTHDADEFGTYSKPSGGIPKSDLASDVQLSLGKADNAQPKETGKGLSTNDYDDTEKGKVASNTNARHSHTNKTLLDGISTYLKNASLSQDEKTLTLTKQDGSTLDFQGGNDVNLSVVNGKLCITFTE